MSRIYFHTRDEYEAAQLRGSERAWMGVLTADLATSLVPRFLHSGDPRMQLFHPRVIRGDRLDDEAVRLFLRIGLTGDDVLLDEEGKPLANFALILNTALKLGSDPLCLMARIHASCEVHGYIEGKDREWVASIIDLGRTTGIMRAEQGWEALRTFLLADNHSPVVMSYSVTDGWPDAHLEGHYDEAEGEPVGEYALPYEEQFDLALGRLREAGGYDISPKSLREPYEHRRDLIELLHTVRPREAEENMRKMQKQIESERG